MALGRPGAFGGEGWGVHSAGAPAGRGPARFFFIALPFVHCGRDESKPSPARIGFITSSANAQQ
jgi:hypothetical protein